MKITLSERVRQIKPSPTLSLSAQANQLKNSGKPIINLTIGEPDFDTPELIKQAAKQALDQGFTKYTAVDGIPALKQAIITKFHTENQLSYEPGQIIVSSGAKQSIYNLMQALLNPHDEVIIPAPYWTSYPDIALLASAKPVIIKTDIQQDFKITPHQLAQAITPQTRLLIINSPCNPTGMVYSPDELFELAEILKQHEQIIILSDDIYEHIYWGETEFKNIVNICPDLYTRTVVLNGCSKAYAMTGWRIGYAAGPKELIQAMINIQSQSTSNPNSIAQVAAVAALKGNQDFIRQAKEIYKQRHDLFFQGLVNILGINCCRPATGAFYLFPSFHSFIGIDKPFQSDTTLASYLLKEACIASIPGSAFGSPNHLRFSFAVEQDTLQNALEKLAVILKHLFDNEN